MIVLQPSLNQRNVCFLDLPTGELRCQSAMCCIVLRDYDEAARSLIQPMHYSGTRFAAHPGELPKAMQERIDQCAAIALLIDRASTHMHHHSCRFINYGKIAVLINYVQRNVFWHSTKWRYLRRGQDRDALATAQSQRGLGLRFVDLYLALRDQLLHTGSADFGEPCSQKLIQTLARCIRRDLKNNWSLFRHPGTYFSTGRISEHIEKC